MTERPTSTADRGPQPTVVRVRELEIRYGDVVAVTGVSLEVERGSLTALVGASGCGKTSLLRAVAGFEEPTAGEIEIDGRPVSAPGTWVPPERRRVGMVFQQGALFPHLTVEGNVLYGLQGRPDARRRVSEVLALVGLGDVAERFPDELSGGQQQRVALARALAPGPQVVLLDEPFANLDSALRVRLREEVREILRAAHATAILVTHDQEEALSVADTVAVMRDGRVLQTGAPAEIYHRPASVAVARFLGDGQLVPCQVRAGQASSCLGPLATDAPEGAGLLLVRPEDVEALPRNGQPAPRGAAGVVRGRRFFGHDVLDEVELESGETLAVRHLSSVPYPVGTEVRLVLRSRPLPVFPPAVDPGEDTAAPLGEVQPVEAPDREPVELEKRIAAPRTGVGR